MKQCDTDNNGKDANTHFICRAILHERAMHLI